MCGFTCFIGELVCLFGVSINCFATTWYVNPGQSIQNAINGATHGDTVIVLPGTYYENIFFNGKNIVLTSTDPDSSAVVASTIIDGNDSGSVVTFDGSETTSCILAGFKIQNGFVLGGGGIDGNNCYAMIQNNTIAGNEAGFGGGLYACDGTIQNNTISGNKALNGGGLYSCHGTIRNNTISGNSATQSGGGLYRCFGTIQNNTISGNKALNGGGGLYYCDGTILDNTIIGNSVDGYFSDGGGLYYCNGTIQNNIISGNSAKNGGGLNDCFGTIQNNTVTGNSAGVFGGGLFRCEATIVNCIIWGNTAPNGPQLYQGSTPSYSCIQDWTGGGEGNISGDPLFVGYAFDTGTWTTNSVYDAGTFQSRLTDTGAAWPIDSLTGMFVRPDTATVLQYLIVSNTDTAIMVWCDLSDSVITGDSYEIYDYHLQAGSACIDAGDSSAIPADVTDLDDDGDTTEKLPFDLDGNQRLVESTWDDILQISSDNNTFITLTWPPPNCGDVDMGAYEYQVQFTVQSRDVLDSGTWQDIFTGNVGTWTDTSTAGVGKRFYRVFGE